ncbi:DNA polymerase III subunit delta' [Bacillus massiliigorillae]|uniref:DNA polymerase III subunit delta' n=1 Tax=Bacillus massiliigorillae TaxID=1243664 RepID=UPI0003AB00EF|nr:DNA polymerase III subunit delta' [Bacillus massiliigorillae]
MINTWNELKEIQPLVCQMLSNSLAKKRVAHAYLFEGERGTGKKEASILLAKSLYCEQLDENNQPCNHCANCRRISSGNHPDVHLIEPDGLSIKKDQIHLLQDEFSKKSVESERKVYIIEAAEKMTVQAANSLLKFLEEPLSETTAILITEQSQRILPTIVSRCQMITFQPLSSEQIKNRLVEEGVDIQTAAIASHLTNHFEEARAISFDDWFAQAQRKVLKLYEVLNQNYMKGLLYLQEEWLDHFKDKEQIDRGLDLLLLIYKDLLYIQLDQKDSMVFQNMKLELEKSALHHSQRMLATYMEAILEAKRRLMSNTNPQLVMEQLVLNLQEGSSFV